MARVAGDSKTPSAAKGGVTGDKKISGLKKPGRQANVKGIQTPFANRIVKGLGGRR